MKGGKKSKLACPRGGREAGEVMRIGCGGGMGRRAMRRKAQAPARPPFVDTSVVSKQSARTCRGEMVHEIRAEQYHVREMICDRRRRSSAELDSSASSVAASQNRAKMCTSFTDCVAPFQIKTKENGFYFYET